MTNPVFWTRNVEPAAFALALVFVLSTLAINPAQAQTYTVLHNFTGGGDGRNPQAGLTADAVGNLYGTTYGGGSQNCQGGCGTVFKLTHKNGGWILTTLHSFQGGSDSAYPAARVIFGPDGALYGTTAGGSYASCSEGCGTVFQLRPPATFCASVSCPWTKTTLYSFSGFSDGVQPQGGDLVFDPAGNIYGTTYYGGSAHGLVFKLTHSGSGWTESVLYAFTGFADGGNPNGGVVFDNAGNLYGTTYYGGYNVSEFFAGDGVIFELTNSGSGWTETVLYSFMDQGDGALPAAGLTMDGVGNFYGTTVAGGDGNCNYYGEYHGCGAVFRNLGETIYGFDNMEDDQFVGPMAPVTLDAQGNIYGTSYLEGAHLNGNVFKLSAGQYAYTSLHDFTFDTGEPVSNVILDSNGNLYGTTTTGGPNLAGTVWELTP